jgi:hypothetical protein
VGAWTTGSRNEKVTKDLCAMNVNTSGIKSRTENARFLGVRLTLASPLHQSKDTVDSFVAIQVA